ncbi:MAG: hypothetical protein RRY29_03735 [Desulfovibrionaceae bacterium]
MAEQRKKSHSILLTINSKVVSLELYDAALWPAVSSVDGTFRVRIDGCWHCSTGGKYSFLTMHAVAELIATLCNGGTVPMPAPTPTGFYRKARVRVHFGECVEGIPLRCTLGSVLELPLRGEDGRWWVWVSIPHDRMMVPVDDVELL